MLRFYSPVNTMGTSRERSVYLTTLSLGRLSPLKRLTSIVHIFLPETDNCPSCLFVCVEVLRPSQPNGVMSSAVSLPNHTFTGQA